MARTMQKKQVNNTEESVVKPKKKFDQSDGIVCRSVTEGRLYMVGKKTHILYTWDDYGDETEVEYADLVASIRANRKNGYVFTPCFIIQDEDFIEEYPQVKQFYEKASKTSDLKSILNEPVDKMVEDIKALPPTAMDALKNMAATQVQNGKLDSVKKIRALDDLFGTDLNLLASLFE